MVRNVVYVPPVPEVCAYMYRIAIAVATAEMCLPIPNPFQ